MITSYNFSIYDITNWILDIDSPYHICNFLQGLQVSRRFEQGERFLNVGDGRSISVLALEILKLIFESHTVVLNDCHFYLSFFLNIISIGVLAKKNDYKILIKKYICNIILNGVTIFYGHLNNGVYMLSQMHIYKVPQRDQRIFFLPC